MLNDRSAEISRVPIRGDVATVVFQYVFWTRYKDPQPKPVARPALGVHEINPQRLVTG